MAVPEAQLSRYGIVAATPVAGRVYRVSGIVEKPAAGTAPTNLASVKATILSPTIFELLERTPRGQGGETWLADAINDLARIEPVFACEFDGRRYDPGDKLGFLQATVEFALAREDLGPAFREYLKSLEL
jgi:UTP--glucose-1-phosphate uridylyltransferase